VRRVVATLLVAGGCAGDGIARHDAAPPDGRPPPDAIADARAVSLPCGECEPDEVCEGNQRDCVGFGSADCPLIDRVPLLRGFPAVAFDDVVGTHDVRATPFDARRAGTVSAVTASSIALTLDDWGARTLELAEDVSSSFMVGDAIAFRLCVELSAGLIDRAWMVELEGPRAALAATGLFYEHHSRCLPSGIVRMTHGATECAPGPDPFYRGVRLAVPLELELAGGAVVRAHAGEIVETAAGALDVRTSYVGGDRSCIDCPSASLQLTLRRGVR
jgi:hypothetical protein